MPEIDPDIRKVLEYVSRGRRYVDVEKYPDATARRALGRILDEEAAEAATEHERAPT
jgi:hypothetical protein